MSSPVSEGYGVKQTAKYQGQDTTTVSRLFDDEEFRSWPHPTQANPPDRHPGHATLS
jgi:hypothetical protein